MICGLGNPGDEYAAPGTTQDLWYWTLFAKASKKFIFEDKRYGFVAETTLKGRSFEPAQTYTFMNLSGNAVRYSLNQEKIDQSRLLVISDELALPLGAFRLKAKRRETAPAITDWDISQQLMRGPLVPLRAWPSATIIHVAQIDWVLGESTRGSMKQLHPAIDLGCKHHQELRIGWYRQSP